MRSAATRGFTLIEVVVATAIVATIAAGVSHVALLAAEQSALHRRQLKALVLAQSKLEELRALPALPGNGSDVVDGTTRQWTVSPLDASPPAALVLRVCVQSQPVCVNAVRVVR